MSIFARGQSLSEINTNADCDTTPAERFAGQPCEFETKIGPLPTAIEELEMWHFQLDLGTRVACAIAVLRAEWFELDADQHVRDRPI